MSFFFHKVVIAGAGPGDPELVTLKLHRALKEADVVVTDRLVNTAILDRYVNPSAEIILAGKQGYNQLSTRQLDINDLLVLHAREGKRVVRLKGGDVAFYSNVLDELQALKQAGIPYEIIPGITAASGASAYAAIPLTARGYSCSVRFILFDNEQSFTTNEWVCMANSQDTIVAYMGVKKLPLLLEQFRKYGAEINKPVAVVEQASTPYQRVHRFSVQDDLSREFLEDLQTPALVIIGDVVSLHDTLSWYRTLDVKGSVFPSLEKKEVVTVSSVA